MGLAVILATRTPAASRTLLSLALGRGLRCRPKDECDASVARPGVSGQAILPVDSTMTEAAVGAPGVTDWLSIKSIALLLPRLPGPDFSRLPRGFKAAFFSRRPLPPPTLEAAEEEAPAPARLGVAAPWIGSTAAAMAAAVDPVRFGVGGEGIAPSLAPEADSAAGGDMGLFPPTPAPPAKGLPEGSDPARAANMAASAKCSARCRLFAIAATAALALSRPLPPLLAMPTFHASWVSSARTALDPVLLVRLVKLPRLGW
mmetsp:Transcript_63038/g.186211  ORF Transcript_63038/g.186211 Transcript_63038/m.186211 type:complete len:259 (-) Transcript_63038:1351-2127(-)